MTSRRRRPGPELPYRVLAGVVPCSTGWLAVTGKLQGVTLLPEGAQVFEAVRELLDYRPSFDIIAIHAPIGLLSRPQKGGRSCDKAARKVLGHPRGAAVFSPPSRSLLAAPDWNHVDEGLSAVAWTMISHIDEVAREIGSYHQRTVYEVHPELSFLQLNGDVPLRASKRVAEGQEERRALLVARLPGIERALEAPPKGIRLPRLLDAGAALWTARRIAARAITRVPDDPEWDDEGIRMEIVR
jgi:predicted RNase H-like nuclease